MRREFAEQSLQTGMRGRRECVFAVELPAVLSEVTGCPAIPVVHLKATLGPFNGRKEVIILKELGSVVAKDFQDAPFLRSKLGACQYCCFACFGP